MGAVDGILTQFPFILGGTNKAPIYFLEPIGTPKGL